ncbi:hypothetical protein R3I94_008052 [Phoxinus phoxinus]
MERERDRERGGGRQRERRGETGERAFDTKKNYCCISAALTLRPWRRMKTRLKSLKEHLKRGRGWKDVWIGTERDSERDGRVF